MIELVLFLPQMRLSFADLVVRARAAEDAGFTGVVGMDHLAPPLAEDQPMYEAMVTATWLAAHTERMKVGSLVLCDAVRHPAVLARQVVSIDHASGGRFELGIGWGSVPQELVTFGVSSAEPAERVARLGETLEVLRALWRGEAVDREGAFHRLDGARQQPVPLGRIPIVIGGVGRRTLALVREFADWWNVPSNQLHRLDELRDAAGAARASTQEVVAFVAPGADREEVVAAAQRRFAWADPVVGTGDELVEHLARRREQGVERVYTWFTDFAPPETLAAFGEEVISTVRAGS